MTMKTDGALGRRRSDRQLCGNAQRQADQLQRAVDAGAGRKDVPNFPAPDQPARGNRPDLAHGKAVESARTDRPGANGCVVMAVLTMPPLSFRLRRDGKARLRRVREWRMVCGRAAFHQPSGAGAHHSDPPVQSLLRILQRVRRFFEARADRGDAASASISWRRWELVSFLSAAANRCCIRIWMN